MSSKKSLTPTSYHILLKNIQSKVFEARHSIERTFVSMYWSVGEAITGYLTSTTNLNHPSIYGKMLFKQLSTDLNIDQRTLYQAVQFYKTYPQLDRTLPLSWSHYRYLSSIDSPAARQKWEKCIMKNKLSINQLLQMMQQERENQNPNASSSRLTMTRGTLYHYRIIKINSVHASEAQLMIDCGFNNRIDIPSTNAKISNTRIVLSEKVDSQYTVKLSKKTKKDIYTYIAVVERVVDGDTLVVEIDCGFGIFRKERLRLKGIDAPEINTIAGKRAKAFLEKEMNKVEYIVIKTYWEDKYGRYIVDVFYDPKHNDPHLVAAAGIHLNQALLDNGYAKKYSK